MPAWTRRWIGSPRHSLDAAWRSAMADAPADAPRSLPMANRQPLIGVAIREGGTWGIRYFTSQDEADAAAGRDNLTWRQALAAASDLSDLEFHEMLDELDRIRHRNPPTPLQDPLP